TVVDAPDRAALTAALRAADVDFEVLRSGLTVRSADPAQIGAIAAAAGVALSGLQRRGPGLEDVFFELVNGVRVHASATGGAVSAAAPEPDVEPEVEPEPVVEPIPESESESTPAPEPEVEP